MRAKLLKIYRKKYRKLKRLVLLAVREFFALLHVAGLRRKKYAHLVFSRTVVMRMLHTAKNPAKNASLFVMKATAMAMVAVIVFVPLLQAFEAHVINVTATPIQIDPPVQNLPGPGTSWNDPAGAFGLTSPINVAITEDDPDATHLFYTFMNGTTTPEAVPDPVCGGPLGGPVSGSYSVYVPSNSVVKSIACDGADSTAHHSVVNTKIYIFACQPKSVNFDPAGPAVQVGGSNAAEDDVLIDADTTVNGTVRSNHDIKAHAASTRDINGDAIAVGSVDPEFNVSGNTATGTAPSSLLDLQLNYWKDQAIAGGTVIGNIDIPNSATTGSLSLGPSEINGDLVIGTNNDITITGTLYVHGNITIHSNVNISQSSEFQDKLTMIIADGIIGVDSNVTFAKYGNSSNTGAFILVSTHAAVAGNPAAVELNSNAKNHDAGDVILFATNGDVRVHSKNTVLGVFGTHGTEANYPAVMLDSNVTVNYRAVSGLIGCGKPFYASSNIVINEFMPNPLGADNATMPGGEWVELYNGTGTDKDVAGWKLTDIGGDSLMITATNTDLSTTTIPSGGHLVVYRNADAHFGITNQHDRLSLYNASNAQVDSYEYDLSQPVDENKSFSRMPDGSANWIDPEATPGGPNETFIVEELPDGAGQIAFTYPDESATTTDEAVAVLGPETASGTEILLAETSTSTQASSTDVGEPQASSTEPIIQDQAPAASSTAPAEPAVADSTSTPDQTQEPVSEPSAEQEPGVVPQESEPATEPTPEEINPAATATDTAATEPEAPAAPPATPEAPSGE